VPGAGTRSVDRADVPRRDDEAYHALLALRPTEPAALARLLRWLLAKIKEAGDGPGDDAIFEHIATLLGAMGATA
jgi:hypothetical protein